MNERLRGSKETEETPSAVFPLMSAVSRAEDRIEPVRGSRTTKEPPLSVFTSEEGGEEVDTQTIFLFFIVDKREDDRRSLT